MRTTWKSGLLIPFAVLFMAGCQESDWSFETSAVRYDVGKPISLPPDHLPVAGSPDGSLIATVITAGEQQELTPLQILRTDDLSVACEVSLEQNMVPMLFDTSGKNLYVAEKLGDEVRILAFSVATGEWGEKDRIRTKAEPPMGLHNSAFTVVVGADNTGDPVAIFTASGEWLEAPPNTRVLFDPAGVAWFRQGSGWTSISDNGVVSRRQARPAYLTENQPRERGSLTLFGQEHTQRHLGASAYLTTIWLQHRDSPSIVRERRNGAALVYSAPDVYSYGFVPKRNLIYVITGRGSYLVPYKGVTHAPD